MAENIEEEMPATTEPGEEKGYDASDPAQVNLARKKSGRKKLKNQQFITAIMNVPEGREWMYDLITHCNPLGNPVIAGDTHLTYHNIGAANIGKKLLQDINEAAPDQYIVMIKEARSKKY